MMKTSKHSQRGSTLIEVTFSTAILSVLLLSIFGVLERQGQLGTATLSTAITENRAIELASRLRRELVSARGKRVRCVLTAPLSAGASGSGSVLEVSTTTGFPPTGTLLVDAGTGSFERIEYASLDLDEREFGELSRGLGGTIASSHSVTSEWIWWSGMACPVEGVAGVDQGTAWLNGREVPFRGDGLGFSYRVPVDLDGGVGMPDYLDGLEPAWGAITRSGPDGALAPNGSGWCAISYEPNSEITEVEFGSDINKDGDESDIFEIGRLVKHTWDTLDPLVPVHRQALGPSCILQERDAPGADLNGDGYEDPLFLWDADTRILSVRLFLFARGLPDQPTIRIIDVRVFLRNAFEEVSE
jgi:type II secretory pathway pseudopilin PulG